MTSKFLYFQYILNQFIFNLKLLEKVSQMIVFSFTSVLLLEDRFFMFDATTGRTAGNNRNIK